MFSMHSTVLTHCLSSLQCIWQHECVSPPEKIKHIVNRRVEIDLYGR